MSTYAVPVIPTPPDTDDIKVLREYIQQLANITAMTMKELDWLINGNMDAKNIRANSIVAKLINVDQLSAISADMGTLTAGIIYGAYIATANGTYPRIEFSSSANLLQAFGSATEYIRITPFVGVGPALVFQDGAYSMAVFQDGPLFNMTTVNGVAISTNSGDVDISSALGNVKVGRLKVDGGTQFNTITQSGSASATLPQLEAQVNLIIQNLRAMKIYAT